jgi:hypothetical protein
MIEREQTTWVNIGSRSNGAYEILTELNQNSRNVFSKQINKDEVYNDPEFLDIFNFSLYYSLVAPKSQLTQICSFKEINQNLKKFISLNKNNTPLFYHSTIYRSLLNFNKLLDDYNSFFKFNENLVSLKELLEFIPELYNKLTLDYKKEVGGLINTCIEQIQLIYSKLNNLNNKCNNLNKNEINFLLNFYNKNSLDKKIEKNGNGHITQIAKKKENINTINNKDILNNDPSSIKNTNILNNINGNGRKYSFITNESDVKNLIHLDDINNARIYNNYILDDNFIVLKAKTKKYSINHFTKESFSVKYLKTSGIKENSIHHILKRVALDYYENKVSKNIDSIKESIDYEELYKIFAHYFRDHRICVIGSSRAGLLYELNNKTPSIDLLLLPDQSKPMEEQIKQLNNNLDGILSLLNRWSKRKDVTHLIKNLDKVKDEHLMNFYCNFNIVNNKLNSELNVNLIFYDEKLKRTSDIIREIFSKNPQLKAMHVFFQEIFISKIKLIKSRRDLSYLMVTFFDSEYNIFNDNLKKRNFYILGFKDCESGSISDMKNVSKYFIRKDLISKNYTYLYPELMQESLKKLNKINLGELMLEFFRYAINFFIYIKNEYSNRINQNFQACKGFDYLKEKYYDKIFSNSQYNLINLNFMHEVLYYHKRDYDNGYCKRVDSLEEIFFKICENTDKITSISQILENINEI